MSKKSNKRVLWTEEEWEFCLNCFAMSKSTSEAVARHQQRYNHRTAGSIKSKFDTQGEYITRWLAKSVEGDEIEDALEITRLKEENSNLRTELQQTRHEAVSGQKVADFLHGYKDAKIRTKPSWLKSKSNTASTTGIPVLFLSDIHFDEYVDPEQINHMNEFGHDIATKRIQFTFEKSIDLLMNHMHKPQYDGVVVALGGDLLSGNIHEELAETNEAPILQSAIDLTELLCQGLRGMADTFDKVFVPCVVGNHGRLHRKPRAKNRVKDNYEWMIYHMLSKTLADDERISFYVPESADAIFSIYDTKILLTHGDQFRGGTGISGIFSPLMLGFARKQKKQQAVGNPFDIMMMGHWHQYIHTENLIVNGSIKGYDEYASICNFPFEPPKQALFIVHPHLGVTYRMPIICDAYKDYDRSSKKDKKIRIW